MVSLQARFVQHPPTTTTYYYYYWSAACLRVARAQVRGQGGRDHHDPGAASAEPLRATTIHAFLVDSITTVSSPGSARSRSAQAFSEQESTP